jgi:hypothetical protein
MKSYPQENKMSSQEFANKMMEIWIERREDIKLWNKYFSYEKAVEEADKMFLFKSKILMEEYQYKKYY